MTIGVEDYFQIEGFASTVDRSEWELLPHPVERNTNRLLDILAIGAEALRHDVIPGVAEVAARLVALRVSGPAAVQADDAE